MPSKVTVLQSLLTGCFLLLVTVAFSQKIVTGKVIGKNNQPVEGATISVKGTQVATSTGSDGSFSINVPANRNTLVVSSIGFANQEVTIGTGNVNVILSESISDLNEIVVTGYSSQARKDITGSVAVVKVADLKSVPASSAESQLQGRAAGVSVVTDNRPGAGALVRIRGFGSFGAFGQNNPLYVIDGVPSDGIGGLNPNDIESMQILKDAASASIYGARASAGVIIITTKKGKAGGAKVSYNMYYGKQNPGKGLDLLNSQEMADLTWLAYNNAGQTPPSSQYGSGSKPVLPDYILPAGKFEGDPDVNPDLYNLNLDDIGGSYLIMKANKQGTNWYDEITQIAPITNHNINLSGGADKSRYMMSFDYFDQDGIFLFSKFKRYTVRVNTEFNVKNNIRIGENLQILSREGNTVGGNSSIGNNSEGTAFTGAYLAQPIIPVFDIKGNFAGARAPNLGNGPNPYADLYRRKDNREQNFGVFGNVYAEVDLFNHFTARTSLGGQLSTTNNFSFFPKTYERAENNSTNSYNEYFNRSRSWTWTNQLSYKNTFRGVHDISALVGTEAVEDWGRDISGTRASYFIEDPSFRSLNSGTAAQQANGAPFTPSALFSVFGKVDYSFQNKFLAGFAIRRDGSSRFGPNNPYGVFPAGSIGWRLSAENFMQNIKWITDLKLRASYGALGNQKIDAANAFTQFRGGIGSSNYDLNGSSNSTIEGFQLSFVGNPDGKWETNITQNVGFDATLFGGKTEVVFELYKKKTKDLLFNVPAIASAGAGAASNPAFLNVATMQNTGMDLLITQRGNIGGADRVNFDLTFTLTTFKNKITSLAEGFDFFDTRGSRIGTFIRNQVGYPISSYYGYQITGFFSDSNDVKNSPVQDGAGTGRFKYADLNGNDTIDIDDRTILGSPHPDFSYGFNLNLAYKRFDISMFFYGAQGKETMNYVRWWIDFFPSFQNVKSKDALYNSWTPENPNAKAPIAENASNFSNNNAVNSYYLEKSSYLRMKNLTIGYTIPNSISNRAKIDRFRIFAQATNLFTLTNYTGRDPEITGGDTDLGVDEGVYPTVRQYLVGVNLNF